MKQHYSSERNIQILISLLKQHGIRRFIVSPGSTNVTFVASLQIDPWFKLYSCVDERSAAYIACGMSAELNEPIGLSCTGATASRNYMPALTEAYYRKLPILAVTSTQNEYKIGHLIPQVINRNVQANDICKLSVHLNCINNSDDEWNCIVKANEAILELNHHGKGPVHINLATNYSTDYSIKELPKARKISRITVFDKFPDINEFHKIAIFVGSHVCWTKKQIEAIDKFCSIYNSVVFCDPTSNYNGKYKINYQIVSQQSISDINKNPDLLIHIGEMSNFYNMLGEPKVVWRVSEDGKLVDTYRKLSNVFEMPEETFFMSYSVGDKRKGCNSYFESCNSIKRNIIKKELEIPFSHIWIASKLAPNLPDGSILHLGILSPLRSWGYFDFSNNVEIYCNQGGFGIDGNISSLLGSALAKPDKICFGVVGDLSFFYDMNILGNRHISNNLRILIINNSKAAEFHLFKQKNILCVDDIDSYISAANHFGKQSPDLVKDYAENLNFEYITASSKESFEKVYQKFISKDMAPKPIVFEVFTSVENEDIALKKICSLQYSLFGMTKQMSRKLLGDKNFEKIKSVILK